MGNAELLMMASNSELELMRAVVALSKKPTTKVKHTRSRYKRVIEKIRANPAFSMLFRNAPPSEVEQEEKIPVDPFAKLRELVQRVYEVKPEVFSGDEQVLPKRVPSIADHPAYKEFVKDSIIPEIVTDNLQYTQRGEPIAWEPYALLVARVKKCPFRPHYKPLYEALCVGEDFSVSDRPLAQVALEFIRHIGIAASCDSADDVQDYWEEQND